MAAISEIVRSSLTKLTELTTSKALLGLSNQVPIHAWTDELGRLRVWAANIGAHQVGRSSLDYRLRDASHIKGQVIQVLHGLDSLLDDLDEILHETGMDTLPSSEDQDLGLYGEAKVETGDTEIQEIYTTIVHIVSNLYQLSMIIRKPAPHDRLVAINEGETQFFKDYAMRHVSQKFPLMENFLVDRLSTAMSKQRAILKYRERHNEKLAWGLDDTRSRNQPSETTATTYNPDQPFESDNLSQGSVTSYAPSLFMGDSSVTVPLPPKDSANKNPFECPYCYYTISIKDLHDWARHVFHDLMPYVCIHFNCSVPTRLYGSRRRWYNHVSTTHAPYNTADTSFKCALCGQEDVLASTFERHVSRHLEDLALLFLPRLTDYDSTEEVNGVDVNGNDNDILSTGAEIDSLLPEENPAAQVAEVEQLPSENSTAPVAAYVPIRP
jgi:hypothetical protein